MKPFLQLLILFICSIYCSCKKEDTNIMFTLPAKTESGKNSFGFLINSVVWINYGEVCFPFAGGCRENLTGTFYSNDGDIHIQADRVLNKKGSGNSIENIDLYISTKFRGIQTYSTASNDVVHAGYWFTQQGEPMKSYLLSKSNPFFTISITRLDTLNKIMAGEFSGKLFRRISESTFETSTTDSMIVSDGRFDIKLK